MRKIYDRHQTVLIRLANNASGTVVRRLTDVPQEALKDGLLPNCKTRECQQERRLQLFRNPIRGKIINTRRRYIRVTLRRIQAMSKTMLRIVAIAMIVLIVALSGCVGGDEKPAEVEPTPAATPETPAATPAETPAATPAETQTVEDTKTADAEEGFTPKSSDRPPLKDPSGGCEGLDQSLLGRYDLNKNGLIDSKELETAKIGYEHNYEKQSDYEQILYAYEHQCSVAPAE
jgi:hypothetical protein